MIKLIIAYHKQKNNWGIWKTNKYNGYKKEHGFHSIA